MRTSKEVETQWISSDQKLRAGFTTVIGLLLDIRYLLTTLQGKGHE